MRTLTRPLDKILRNKLKSIIEPANGIDETAAIAALKQLAVSYPYFIDSGIISIKKNIAHELSAV